MRLRLASTFLGILLLGTGGEAAAKMELKVGQPFPEVALPSLEDGRPAAISSFRGRKLILHIFASW